MLEGGLLEGDPLPSVRKVAAEYRVNPLTVMKAYQQLVNDGLVEARRGLGMYINTGARALLLSGERERFLGEEWPKIYASIQRLGLKAEDLLNGTGHKEASGTGIKQSSEPATSKAGKPVPKPRRA